MKAATADYRAESDTLAQFLDEECELDDFLSIPKTVRYRAYEGFTGGRCESKRAFGIRLIERGFVEVGTRKQGRSWRGIGLCVPVDEN